MASLAWESLEGSSASEAPPSKASPSPLANSRAMPVSACSQRADPTSCTDRLASSGTSPASTVPPTRQSSAQEGGFLASKQQFSRALTPSWMQDDDPFAGIVRRAAAPSSLTSGPKRPSDFASSFSSFGAHSDSVGLASSTLSDEGLTPVSASLPPGETPARTETSARNEPAHGSSPALGSSSNAASPLFFSDADLEVLAAPSARASQVSPQVSPFETASRDKDVPSQSRAQPGRLLSRPSVSGEETPEAGAPPQNAPTAGAADDLDEFFSSANLSSRKAAAPASPSASCASPLAASGRSGGAAEAGEVKAARGRSGEQTLGDSLIDGDVPVPTEETAGKEKEGKRRAVTLRRESDGAEYSPTAAESWSVFNSQMQNWEVVQKEGRRQVADVEEHQLEDAGKKTIWVVHQGACTPVSWYEDTSADDVKAAVLCACDVMLDDDMEEPEEGKRRSKGRTCFALRQIEPLPQTADVDCDSLFLDVCVLHLRDEGGMGPDRLIGGSAVRSETGKETGNEETAAEREAKKKALRVMKGRRVRFDQFGHLMDGCTYMLEKFQETPCTEEAEKELQKMQSITGDRWRRLLIPVHPLLHIESQKAFERMMKGTNLLKHTSYGYPHLRQFQLSMDRRRLLWYTSSKAKSSSVVHLALLHGILFGQKSPTFESYRLPGLQHLSFSLVFWSRGPPPETDYDEEEDEDEEERKTRQAIELRRPISGARTLDLTCKDEFEFDMWVTGLKAIIAANKGLRISKKLLLSHSRRFRRALAHNNVTIKLTALPEVKEPGQVNLDDCMDLPWHPPEVLQKKYDGLQRRIQAAAVEIRHLNYRQPPHGRGATIPDVCELSGSGPAYAGVYEVGEADDEEMEHRRMVELLHQVFSVLSNARVALSSFKSEIERQRVAEAARESERTASRASSDSSALDASGSEPQNDEEREEVVVSISSSGEIKKKSPHRRSEGEGTDDLTFEEKFKKYSSRSAASLEAVQAVQEQVKDSVLTLWQQAAPITQEAQKFFEQAVAAVVGNDEDEMENLPNEDGRSWTPEEISRLKQINQLLWKAEVDLENVEDILARFRQTHLELARGLVASVTDLNQKLSEEVHRWGSQLSSFMSDFVSRLNTLPAALVADDAAAALRATAASAASLSGPHRHVSSVESRETRQETGVSGAAPPPPPMI
ncbi:conserved hypothetical protein [Neospora caninum Liverpool]|uniref:PH domain-containing protein n=1 Tax=Neospora caninum (strain Liverpool) TaxID=572307 RepID=F0VLV1_NEOCL|nr:conserved hypothetical protein [Neospora caninum Liverpool]CBZ54229.1 conserved hypothetical protein [Neospora caninum Liverpool]CEL68930.1 TPA: hypothetical protein BN1204_046610 [Neospora caninum Liverpool]|eukprot:XP_003884260.1 conserved hypothetical protein [Neospora caninum Liverpool]